MSRPSRKSDRARWALLGLFLVLTPACQQQMSEQPYYRPYDKSEFFEDQRSARPLEAGTIARGQYLTGDPMTTGLRQDALTRLLKIQGGEEIPEGEREKPVDGGGDISPAPDAPSDPAKFVEEYPFEITQADLERGAERYSIYCVACHGPLGNGRGKIWERGYLQPTSFLEGNSRGFERWRVDVAMNPFNKGGVEAHVPEGYFFEVITKGFGGMPSYNSQIKPADRWRIIAYVRALQLSRGAKVDELPDELRTTAREKLGE